MHCIWGKSTHLNLRKGSHMRSFSLCVPLVAALIAAGFAASGTIHVEQNPAIDQNEVIDPGATLSIWDMQFAFDASGASGALGNTGAEFDGTYFYSTRWASNLIHQYDIDGNLVKEFSIPGVSGLRDLAYDGTYFQYVSQWDLSSGSFTGVTHDVLTDFPGTDGIAGGLFFTTDYIPGTGTLGGMWQTENPYPNMMFCYEICHPAADLEVDISPVNGQVFQPGDWIQYAVTVTNNSTSPIQAVGSIHASNSVLWELSLWGPLSFTIPAETTIGPVNLQSHVPNGAPAMTAYMCAEVNTAHDCYMVTIE